MLPGRPRHRRAAPAASHRTGFVARSLAASPAARGTRPRPSDRHVWRLQDGGIGWRLAPDPSFRLLPGWSRNDDDLSRRDGSLTIAAPDHLRWTAPRRFQLDGRRDRSVQVAGTDVSLTHVRDVLLRHPDVRDAAIRLMLPDEGKRLKAFVVPRDPARATDALFSGLDAFIEGSLSTPERPRAYHFGSALPVGTGGKPADWPVRNRPQLMED